MKNINKIMYDLTVILTHLASKINISKGNNHTKCLMPFAE